MRLKVLGCSGGIGKDLKTSSYIVDDDILLDAGTGVGSLTLDEMKKLKHIFVTFRQIRSSAKSRPTTPSVQHPRVLT